MATVHLAVPVQTWWDVPTDAQDNFERALTRIQANTAVFDLGPAQSAGVHAGTTPGYVAKAVARARQAAATHKPRQNLPDLQSEQADLRRLAVWCSMVSGRRLSDEALRLALQDDDDDVRWFALEAQAGTGAASTTDAQLLRTVQGLVGERQRYVREAATDVLMRCGEEGFELLLELAGRKRQWKKDGRGPFRRRREFHETWALRQYVEEGGEAAAEHLARLADRGGVEVCRGVCAVLERCGDTGIAALVKLLSSTAQDARREALVALMYSGEAALPTLERTIAETEGKERDLARRIVDASARLRNGEVLCWTMRPSTLATVVELGAEAAVETLGRNLKSGSRRECYHAARGLVYAGPASVAVLLDALRSRELLVRRRACEALRDLTVPESRAGLQAALADEDVVVRVNAVRALARIDLPWAREAVVSRAADPSRAVRRAVREGLARGVG
jgi:HEAT repeat protein